jgi:hypothetical protein
LKRATYRCISRRYYVLAFALIAFNSFNAIGEDADSSFVKPDNSKEKTSKEKKDVPPDEASVDNSPSVPSNVTDEPNNAAPGDAEKTPAADNKVPDAVGTKTDGADNKEKGKDEAPVAESGEKAKECKREDPDEEEMEYLYVKPPNVPFGYAGWKTNKVPKSHANDDMLPVPDRWRIPFSPDTRRYTGSIIDPYHQNILKGDYPIIGQSIFFNGGATSDTLIEGHRVPTPSGVTAQRPASEAFFGAGDQTVVQQNFILELELFKGETDFKPKEWAIKLTPVFNINYVATQENFAINIDPRQGSDRLDSHIAFQELFGEYHFRDLSPYYDFASSVTGIQFFNEDFRGFLYADNNLGARLLGIYEANRLQFNLAYFEQFDKDTNSGLNTFNFKRQHVLMANLFRQDTFWQGYNLVFNLAFNDDNGRLHYNTNGVIVRPTPVGDLSEHNVQVGYVGFGGEGHIGRLNISHQFYEAFGRDSHNPLASQATTINAQMFDVEASVDVDWMRFKLSYFYASGDRNSSDGKANGFDSIFDDPNFAGGSFSWWVRQGFGAGNALTPLKNRSSLLPDFRDKGEGQANFVNPGLQLFNAGYTADLTQKLSAILNLNYLRFDNTSSLESLLHQNNLSRDIGYDYSMGIEYRPFLNNQMVVTGGIAGLTPGEGFKQIYTGKTQYSAFLGLTFRY